MSVQSLLSYALTVPELKAGQKFYTTFGLTAGERDGALAFRCDGRDQDQVFLVEGKKKRLNHLRFGSDDKGIAAIRVRMQQRGIEEIDAPHNAFGGGLWLEDPDGHAINVRPESPKPWRAAPAFAINSPGHYQRTGQRGAPTHHPARPHRLGHVLSLPRAPAVTPPPRQTWRPSRQTGPSVAASPAPARRRRWSARRSR